MPANVTGRDWGEWEGTRFVELETVPVVFLFLFIFILLFNEAFLCL